MQLDREHLLPVLLGVQQPDDGHVVAAVLGLVVGTSQKIKSANNLFVQ